MAPNKGLNTPNAVVDYLNMRNIQIDQGPNIHDAGTCTSYLAYNKGPMDTLNRIIIA